MSNRYLQILPQNSNASHSYRDGRPVIDFQISEQEATLLPRSIRVCGRFHAYEDSARTMTTGTRLSMDSRIGVFSMIDQVTIASATSMATIETLKHANRFYSSYMGVTNDDKSLINLMGETGLTMPSLEGQQYSVMQEGDGANSNEFCIHIPTGLLLGTSGINLSRQTGVGGLRISLTLAPDSMVLFDKNGDASAGGLDGAFYELTDLKLVCEVSDQMVSPAPLEYNSITGFYTTINSTNANLNFSLGLNRVASTMLNFIPSDYLNNLNQNSLQTINPLTKDGSIADISQVVFTKGGSRYPFDYNIDTSFKNGNKEQVDPQVVRNFMNSVLPFRKISHTLAGPSTINKSYTTNDNAVIDGGALIGVGCAYDVLGSDGADFSREAWGLSMDIGLTDNNPNSAFVFVHHKNTLLYKDGQVQVIS